MNHFLTVASHRDRSATVAGRSDPYYDRRCSEREPVPLRVARPPAHDLPGAAPALLTRGAPTSPSRPAAIAIVSRLMPATVTLTRSHPFQRNPLGFHGLVFGCVCPCSSVARQRIVRGPAPSPSRHTAIAARHRADLPRSTGLAPMSVPRQWTPQPSQSCPRRSRPHLEL